jgi:hypothetical protein
MAKRTKAPPICAYALRLGKRFPKMSPSAYKVCITPTQAEALFGTTRPPKAIGCGVFACAFEHPSDGKVVKITRDPSDVAGLERGQGLQVPKLYASRTLKGTPKWVTPRPPKAGDRWPKHPTAYALTLERLRPLPEPAKTQWNQRIDYMRVLLAATPPPRTVGELARAVCVPSDDATCELRIRELNKISADLRARGIEWADIHAGNIGIDKNGRWKALDLGASPTKLRVQPPQLDQAGTARK